MSRLGGIQRHEPVPGSRPARIRGQLCRRADYDAWVEAGRPEGGLRLEEFDVRPLVFFAILLVDDEDGSVGLHVRPALTVVFDDGAERAAQWMEFDGRFGVFLGDRGEDPVWTEEGFDFEALKEVDWDADIPMDESLRFVDLPPEEQGLF